MVHGFATARNGGRPVAGTAFLLPPSCDQARRGQTTKARVGQAVFAFSLHARRARCLGWCGLRTAPKPSAHPGVSALPARGDCSWVKEYGERAGVGGWGFAGLFFGHRTVRSREDPELQVTVAGFPGAAQLDSDRRNSISDRLKGCLRPGVGLVERSLPERLSSGNLAQLKDQKSVVEVATNPTIFAAALAEGEAYDAQVRSRPLRARRCTTRSGP